MTAMVDYRGIERQESPSITFQEALPSKYDVTTTDTSSRQHCVPSDASVHVHSNSIIVDTRTPKEFDEAHVINAVNLPLMSNAERHEIGTTYHKESKEAAIIKGWELFSPQIPDYLRTFDEHKGKKILVYCWRGGMRSRIVVNLLRLNGFDAVQLVGGFKRYNNEIIRKGLDAFASSYAARFIVLVGYTGSSKTVILKNLDAEGLPVVDLEGLAGHKGSVYGSVDTVPRSQKMFSILLYHKLDSLKDSPFIFVEAESNKIGDVHLPMWVNEKIRGDVKVLVTSSLDARVAAIRREYSTTADSVRRLHECTDSVSILRSVGKKNVEMLHKMLDDGKFDEFTEWLLVNYYDLRYKHTKADYSYAIEVNSDDVGRCCADLKEFYASLVSG